MIPLVFPKKNTIGLGSQAADRADVSKCVFLLISLYVIMYIACIPVNMLAMSMHEKNVWEMFFLFSVTALGFPLSIKHCSSVPENACAHSLCRDSSVTAPPGDHNQISGSLQWWRCMLKEYSWGFFCFVFFHLHLWFITTYSNLDLFLIVYKQTENAFTVKYLQQKPIKQVGQHFC